jgi:DNA polymerase III sliding clamp (beta) subunit (PCNA family)
MDKKSKHLVTISQDEKYVKVKGNDFTYITRRICGDYFKVNSVIKQDEEYSFYANKKEMMEIMKYNSDLLKDEKKPNLFHAENGELYSYVKTSRYESLDKINVKQINMRDTFFIGFNPRFIYDALDVIDVDFPKLFGTNHKSPMIIEGKEYTCLVLPVNTGNSPNEENFMHLINKSKVA